MKKSENLTCERYWKIDSTTFKSRSKSVNFWQCRPFPTPKKAQKKLFLFFWYTVNLRDSVKTLFKNIQAKNLLPKSLNLSYVTIPETTSKWPHIIWVIWLKLTSLYRLKNSKTWVIDMMSHICTYMKPPKKRKTNTT